MVAAKPGRGEEQSDEQEVVSCRTSKPSPREDQDKQSSLRSSPPLTFKHPLLNCHLTHPQQCRVQGNIRVNPPRDR